jgi:glycine dehydrogenase subunit 1
MLRTIGVARFEDLLRDVPASLRLKKLALAPGLSEMELLLELRREGQKNAHADRNVSFLGGGVYDHYIPSIVGHLATRGEFITSYTPYQGEASQGTLQFIYEFQSLICGLTRMDVANASMYDGASAVAEAALMALRSRDDGRKEILVSETLHPEAAATLATYLSNLDVAIVPVPEREGTVDLEGLEARVSEATAAVIYQSPNFLGYVEDAAALARIAKARGATVIASVNPVSLSVLAPPGDTGADIAVGEGQPLGNPVAYGGPHFGFFAARAAFTRRMPGRICGRTVDRDGKTAFVLTLQAREQHIRREKATSNICTNHSLCALRATIFLSLIGEAGFRKLGELNVERSHEASLR